MRRYLAGELGSQAVNLAAGFFQFAAGVLQLAAGGRQVAAHSFQFDTHLVELVTARLLRFAQVVRPLASPTGPSGESGGLGERQMLSSRERCREHGDTTDATVDGVGPTILAADLGGGTRRDRASGPCPYLAAIAVQR